MPQTINGIGTHYYGKSKLQRRPGSCEFCGRNTTIESYDTRYWFVILFIPIIPLGKKHVFDQCGVCRQHRVMKLDDWDEARAKAMEEGMRKVVDQPGVLEPLVQLHRTCLIFGEWEKADQLSARMEQEFAGDAKAHLHLAHAHAFRGRAGEAEKSLQRAKELDPGLAEHAEELRSTAAPKPADKKRKRILVGVLAAVVLGGILLADWARGNARTLHVINGYEIPLRVRVQGHPELSVSPLAEGSIDLPEGSYTAQVTGPLTAELPFTISSQFLVRLFDSRAFVLNPGGMGLFVREETIYASEHSSNEEPLAPYSLHYGKPYETFSGIDYAFLPFPHEIKLDHAQTLHKRRLGIVHIPVADVFRDLMEAKRAPEALSLAEWAIDMHGSKADVVSVYADAAADPANRERILGGLKSRLGRRPVDITLHRAYQNLSLESPQNTLETEYEAYLKAEPGNSALIYLRGRLVPGASASLSYFERAALADPANSFAQAAIAHCRSSQGKWTEALPPALRACELDPSNAKFQSVLEDIRIALGQFDPLERDLRTRCAQSRWLPSNSLVNLLNLLAFRKNLEGMHKVCEEVRQASSGTEAKTRDAMMAELRARAFYAAGDISAMALEVDKEDKQKSAYHRFALLIEQGQLEEADSMAEKGGWGAFELLDRSIAWSLKGDQAKAGDLRGKAAELFQKSGNRDMQAAAALFQAGPSPSLQAVTDLDMPPSYKAIVVTALAEASPELAPELIHLARGLNTGFAFPRHLLERALGALGPNR
jgi:tetratricopeptide (TPR) repeat protein